MCDPARVREAVSAGPVAVVDWNAGGHHETYLAAYVRGLRATGRAVAVLCRDPAGLRAAMGEDAGIVAAALPGMDWIKARRWITTPLARAWFAKRAAGALAGLERELGARCDRVFLSCLYESQALVARRLVRAFGRPWAGLYLHAGVFHAGFGEPAGRRAAAVMGLLREAGPERIFMLDAGMAGAVGRATGRPVVLVPDLTDTRPGQAEELPAELRGMADGRPVVGLLGHLRPGKGVAQLARLAVVRSDDKLRFVFAGELERKRFSAGELEWIDRARAMPGRVMFYPRRLPDGPCYNAVVERCDVLWAVYPDSPHSSNTLTKAAAFQRPVVVADGYLMARETRDYRLGEVVGRDCAGAEAALARLTDDPAGWRAAARPRWAEFAALHSEERLRAVLAEFFG